MIIPSDKKFGGGITPSGTIQITENGTVDVTDYAQADVNVTDVENALLSGSGLTVLHNDEVTNIRSYCFYYSGGQIKEVYLPNVTTTYTQCFRGMSNLEKIYLPKLEVIGAQAFRSNSKLKFFDLSDKITGIANYLFDGNSVMKSLVIRRTSGIVTTDLNVFGYTPFRNGNGGTVYVPYWITVNNEQVLGTTAYSTANNWSTLYSESTTFASIQENLSALNTLGVDITPYYLIVEERPQTDIATDKVYLIETATQGTYEQWFHGSGAWEQLPNITLESEE